MNLVELVGVGAALTGATWFLVRRFRSSIRPVNGCGGDCGCSSGKVKALIRRRKNEC